MSCKTKEIEAFIEVMLRFDDSTPNSLVSFSLHHLVEYVARSGRLTTLGEAYFYDNYVDRSGYCYTVFRFPTYTLICYGVSRDYHMVVDDFGTHQQLSKKLDKIRADEDAILRWAGLK